MEFGDLWLRQVRNEAIETKMAARKEQLALDLEDLAENCQQFKWNKAKKKKNADCLNFSAGYERSPLFRSLRTKPRNTKASTSYNFRGLEARAPKRHSGFQSCQGTQHSARRAFYYLLLDQGEGKKALRRSLNF